MSSTTNPRVQLIDRDGDPMDDASTNSLKVKIVGATDTLDIGDVQIQGYGTIGHGNNTDIDSGDDEAITSTTTCKYVELMAHIDNAGIIYIGGENVTSATGIALYGGDVFSMHVDNLSKIFARASVDNQSLQWVYFL